MFKCTCCTYISDNKANVRRHMNNKHNIIIDDCNNNNSKVDKINKNSDINNENVDTNNENINTENPEEKSFKCLKCNKSFQKNWLLKRHSDTCKGIRNPFECVHCHKALSSYSALSRHRKTCTSTQLILYQEQENNKNLPEVSVQNINTQQNIETQNNTVIHNQTNNVTINVLKFPEEGDEFDFLCDHITKEMYKKIWDQTKPEIGFRKFVNAILERPENRIIKKNNPNVNYSKIHQGEDKWELAHDEDVFPLFTHQMSCAALQCSQEYKKQMYFMRTDIKRVLQYLDDVNTENDDNVNYFREAVQRIRLMVVNLTKRWEESLAATAIPPPTAPTTPQAASPSAPEKLPPATSQTAN